MNNKFYLVIFAGVPDWEGESTNSYVERKYLFSSQKNAEDFVRRRTKDVEWYTHPSLAQKDSMKHRLKKGEFHFEDDTRKFEFQNEYRVIALALDEVYDEPINESSPYDFVDKAKSDLRRVEGDLEEIGRSICDKKGSGYCWSRINCALSEVREAICETSRMIMED